MSRALFFVLPLALALLATGCMPPQDTEPASAPEASAPRVLNLADGAVYIDELGEQHPVVALEDDAAIECAEATDLVLLGGASGARAAATHPVRALVVGVRRDGQPDVWEVHRNGEIRTVEKMEQDRTRDRTCGLPDCDIGGGRLLHLFGWDYRAVGSAEGADGEVIVVGVATNTRGVKIWKFTIEPGTSVGVYWKLAPTESGRYRLVSFARVIGTLKDWPLAEAAACRPNPRVKEFVWRILSGLKLFFLGLYDSYLTDVSSVAYDGTAYVVAGLDQDGENATAKITGDEIVIEAEEPPPPPPPPPATNPYARLYIESVRIDGVDKIKMAIVLYDANGGQLYPEPPAEPALATGPSIDFIANAASSDVFYIRVTGDPDSIADEAYAIRLVALTESAPTPNLPLLVPDAGDPYEDGEPDPMIDPWDSERHWVPPVLTLDTPMVRHLSPSDADVDWFKVVLP